MKRFITVFLFFMTVVVYGQTDYQLNVVNGTAYYIYKTDTTSFNASELAFKMFSNRNRLRLFDNEGKFFDRNYTNISVNGQTSKAAILNELETVTNPTVSVSVSAGETSALSAGNSSGTALDADSSFVGAAELNGQPDVLVALKTDRNGILYCEFSTDSTNWDSSLRFEVDSAQNEIHRLAKGNRYFRVRFENTSGSDQSYFRLSTTYGNFGLLNAPLMLDISQDGDAIVARIPDETEVTIGKVPSRKIITKFARNTATAGGQDIWDGGGTYTGFPTTAAEVFQLVSSSANDADGLTGARKVAIFYFDENYNMFDGSGNYMVDTITMNGTTPVNSSASGMRVWRVKVVESGSGQVNEGNITVRWATTSSVVFAVIQAGRGQSEISSFTVPNGYEGFLKTYRGGMFDNTANEGVISIKVRDFGTNTFRLVRPFPISTDAPNATTLYGAQAFEEKTDFVFTADSIGSGTADVSVSYGILLVKK